MIQLSGFLQGWRYNEVVLVLLVAVLSVLLWRVPVIGWVFYPFHLFGTFVHEIAHGLAAILTGGEFSRFVVNPDRSGVAWSAGGVPWIITSAGYVGCTLFGGILIILAGRNVSSNHVLTFLGILLGILCLVFVRNLFGIFAGLVIAGLLFAAGYYLQANWANWLLLFLAVQVLLDAINSLFDLVRISSRSNILTDAQIMQNLTGLPAPIWAVFWTMLSFVVLVGALTLAYRDGTPTI